jgi:hypothetical protein
MFENDPLYDVNHPFYYDSNPDSQVKEEDEGKDQGFDQLMRQAVSCLVLLIVAFVALVVVNGVAYLIRVL